MKYFIIGDAHGQYRALDKLLTYRNTDEKIIFLGDGMDRGHHSNLVLERVYKEVQAGGVYLKGNHDSMFEDWLNDPIENANFYLDQGGYSTVRSFLGVIDGDSEYLAKQMLALDLGFNLKEFLQNLPYYYEGESFIAVHAGVNPLISDWKNSKDVDFMWIRDIFHKAKNNVNKTIFFGHTPTLFLTDTDFCSDIWVKDNKVGIDTGAGYNHFLTGVSYDDETKERKVYTIHIKSNLLLKQNS